MNDERLLSLLAESLNEGPPPDAIEAAYAAFGWRTLDDDLAQLIDDSQVEVVGFRDAAFSRVLRYQATHGTIQISVDEHDLQVDVTPRPAGIVLRQTADSQALDLDESGRCSLSGVSGPLRFEILWPGGSTLTPWLTL